MSSSTTRPPRSSENSGSAEDALRRSNRLLGLIPTDDPDNQPQDTDNVNNNANNNDSPENADDEYSNNGYPPHDPIIDNNVITDNTDQHPPIDNNVITDNTEQDPPIDNDANGDNTLQNTINSTGSSTHDLTANNNTTSGNLSNNSSSTFHHNKLITAALREVTNALTDVASRLVRLESHQHTLHTNVNSEPPTTFPTRQVTVDQQQPIKFTPSATASYADNNDVDPHMDALTKALITANRLKPTPESELFTGTSDEKTIEAFIHEITSDFRYILANDNMKVALIMTAMSQSAIAHVTSLYTAKYGTIDSSTSIDASVFLPRLMNVLREAYTTSTAHMDARLSWESLQLQGHPSFPDFINDFQKLRTEVGALRGRMIDPAEALGRLWGCLPPSLRQWAGDYLPRPACQDLSECNLQYYITRLRHHCQNGSYHLATTSTSSATSSFTFPATLASSTPPSTATTTTTQAQTNFTQHNSSSQQQQQQPTTTSPPRPNSSTTTNLVCFRCGAARHQAQQCPLPLPLNHSQRCKRCGHTRHSFPQCRKPDTIRCARCNRIGHLASICMQQNYNPMAHQQQQQQQTTTASPSSPPQQPPPTTTSTSATTTSGDTPPPLPSEQASTTSNVHQQCFAQCLVALPLQQAATTTCPTTITTVNSTTPQPTSYEQPSCENLLTKSTIPEAPKLMMSTDEEPGALYTDLTFIGADSSPHKMRAMIDTGSSRSYINSKTLQQALQLQLVCSYRQTTTLTVVTANGATFTSCLQAQLKLNTRQGHIMIWVHCANQLCSALLIGVDNLLNLDMMILMTKTQPLLRTQVGPLRDTIVKLIDNKASTTATTANDIVPGKANDGELPELSHSANLKHTSCQTVNITTSPCTFTTSPAENDDFNNNEAISTQVQPQYQPTYDFDDYISNYFTSIVAHTTVIDEHKHNHIAEFDPCSHINNNNKVDTLTVVPQPDGTFMHFHKLPWRSQARPHANLRGIQARTEAQLRRLSTDDFQHYNDCIQDLLHRGVIRPLKEDEAPLWAMCHFGVKGHAQSTTPLRPVFTGTGLTPHLNKPSSDVAINVVNPLLLLRTHRIFHIEDLAKAFYSMYVYNSDELWLCFWHQQQWFCFAKCPMGIAPSTGFLAASIDTILKELQSLHYPRPIPTITHVDDITQVFTSMKEREEVHNLNIKHFANHHFHINAAKRITDESTQQRALGLWIDDNGDLMLYSIPPLGNYDSDVYDPLLNKIPPLFNNTDDINDNTTLRVQQAFSYVCACYDPLGLAAETTTRQRLLLRQALTSGLNNNDIMPQELATQLRQCRRQLCNMKPQARFVSPLLDPTGHPIYFACVDASSQAIALTITARGTDRVVAHSLLVPKSKALWTVVRLELQAIILAIPYIDQFVNIFKNTGNLPLIVICSDSLVNVQRLQSHREPSGDLNNWDRTNINKAKQLLKQRGYLIRHLKGSANPADPISRGLSVQQRLDNKPKHYDSDYFKQWIDDFVDNYHTTHQQKTTTTSNTTTTDTATPSNNTTANNTDEDHADGNNNDSLQVDIISLPQLGYDVDFLKKAQQEDSHIAAIIDSLGNRQKLLNIRVQLKYYFLDSDGLLRYYPHHDRLPRPQQECPIVIPSNRAKSLWIRLHEAHNHPGSGTGLRRLQRLIIWHRMPRDVRRWTSQCIICLRSRRERQAMDTINKFTVKSTKPLEVVNIDYCGPYNGSSGSPVALVMVCAATGYVCARLLPDRKLPTLIHCLFVLFHEVGFPSILCCDRDSTILAATDHLASWGIITATIPSYSVKLAWWERVHRQLHDHMRSYLLTQQAALKQNGNPCPPPPSFTDTEKALASSVLAVNETPRGPGGLGITPNMMIRSNGDAMLPKSLVYNYTNSAEATQYVKRLLITPIKDETTVEQLRQGMALSLRQYLQLVRLPHLKRHDGRVRYQVPIDHPASRLKPGDDCYYWRPRAHKLSSSWQPAKFCLRVPGTNYAILEKPGGQKATEYFFNVMCIRSEDDLKSTSNN